MDMSVITIPGHVRDYLGQWIREYDAAVARPVVTDPEGHEQSLMESSRLLGTAGALLRLIEGSAAAAADPYAAGPAPAAAAAVNGYPAGPPGPGYLPAGLPPASERMPDDFDAFAGQQGYQP